jgi:hypothetical protein
MIFVYKIHNEGRCSVDGFSLTVVEKKLPGDELSQPTVTKIFY